MTPLPDREDQLRKVHAAFLHQVAETCQGPERRPAFEQLVVVAEQQGWIDLVHALRRIAEGERSSGLLAGLDEEDRVIAESVLLGISRTPPPCRTQDGTPRRLVPR